MPSLRSDADAEKFVSTADLSQYDLSGFKPMRFEIAQKDAVLTMRLPTALMNQVRARAKAAGVPYSRYVRMVLESELARTEHTE